MALGLGTTVSIYGQILALMHPSQDHEVPAYEDVVYHYVGPPQPGDVRHVHLDEYTYAEITYPTRSSKTRLSNTHGSHASGGPTNHMNQNMNKSQVSQLPVGQRTNTDEDVTVKADHDTDDIDSLASMSSFEDEAEAESQMMPRIRIVRVEPTIYRRDLFKAWVDAGVEWERKRRYATWGLLALGGVLAVCITVRQEWVGRRG